MLKKLPTVFHRFYIVEWKLNIVVTRLSLASNFSLAQSALCCVGLCKSTNCSVYFWFPRCCFVCTLCFVLFWILRNVNFCVFRSFKGLPFSTLLDIEWKLCAHTTNDVQTSKRTQCDTILACCWYQWCEYCRFVIFQLFFLKYWCKLKKQYPSVFELRCVLLSLFWMSSGNCAHTLQATCKHQNLHKMILY